MALVDSYSAVIFDYGGVLVRHQTEADQARMATLVGLPTDRFAELYWSKRADYDKAVLTAAEYWHEIALHAGTKLGLETLDELIAIDTESWMQFDGIMWAWVAQLRKSGKRLAVLSNMPLELGEALKIKPGRLELFDNVTLSYELRAVKPEPAIYEHCLEALDAEPQKTLFFDDRIENVQGAELLGIRAIQFLDRDEVLLKVSDLVSPVRAT
jgi:putative hydrolase of the HAD superfamily